MTKINLEPYIEHLQETGKVPVKDENIEELITALLKAGYKTKFVSTDRDYLILL